MTAPSPAPPRLFIAAIRAYDLDRSLEFYRDGLGLTLLEEWKEGGGGYRLQGVSGGVLELWGKPPEMKVRGGWDFIPPTAKLDLVFEVPDVDAWHAALVGRGLEPQSEPQDAPRGGRWFTILDPDETPVKFLSAGAKKAG